MEYENIGTFCHRKSYMKISNIFLSDLWNKMFQNICYKVFKII